MVGGVEAGLRARGSGSGSERNASATRAERSDIAGNLPVSAVGTLRSCARTSRSTTREPAPCSRSSRAIRRGWGSTPAARRSTRACTSATRGRSSSSRSSSGSSSTRATASCWSATSPTSTTRSTTRRGPPGGRRRSWRRRWPRHYVADTDRLGLGRPDAEPYASEYVGQIIELIQRLIDAGSAYAVSGDVYFRVRTLDSYGELSRRDLDQMDQGEGVEGADLKEDPLDFALWKATKEGEDTSWDSPWGAGPAGLAHRVLGDGRGAARRRVRHPRRRRRPRVPAPRERGGADAGRAREAARADLDAQRDARARLREDGQVGRQHPRARRGARRRSAARCSCCS